MPLSGFPTDESDRLRVPLLVAAVWCLAVTGAAGVGTAAPTGDAVLASQQPPCAANGSATDRCQPRQEMRADTVELGPRSFRVQVRHARMLRSATAEPPSGVGDPGNDGELRSLTVHAFEDTLPFAFDVSVAAAPSNLTSVPRNASSGTGFDTELVAVAPERAAATDADYELTYTLDADVDRIRRLGAETDDIRLAAFSGGRWQPLSNATLSRSGSEMVATVRLPRPVPVALGLNHPNLTVSGLEPPDGRIYANHTASLRFAVRNEGQATGSVPLRVDTDRGIVVGNTSVRVQAGSSRTVTVPVRFNRSGEWEIEIGAFNHSVRVREPRPVLEVTGLSLRSDRIEAGDRAVLTVSVRNVGPIGGRAPVRLRAFDTVVDARDVTVAPGERETVTFEQRIDAPGTHRLRVGNESAVVTVTGEGPTTGDAATPTGAGAVRDVAPDPDDRFEWGLVVLVTVSVLVGGFVTVRRLTADH